MRSVLEGGGRNTVWTMLLAALVLAGPVAAIDDPAGDVGATIGGLPVDAPYVDIRNVTGTVASDVLDLRMVFEAAWSTAPADVELNAIFIVDLEGQGDDNVYQGHDITVLCTKNTTSGAFGCRDTNQDPDTAHAVTGAGIDDRNVTARILLKQADDEVAVAGGSSRVEQGNVTAQDFTDNALPYNSRPAEPEVIEPEPVEESPAWSLGLLMVALLLLARQRA